MLPADKCLHRRDLPGPQVELGLVVQDELTLFDGEAELVAQAPVVLGVEVLIVKSEGATPYL